MHLKDLKKKAPADLVEMAEGLGVESASTLRKQDLMFAILKAEAENGEQIMGEGTIEVLPDGFGFLRSPEANYLAGPDDIYVSPNQVRKFGLRTGDTGILPSATIQSKASIAATAAPVMAAVRVPPSACSTSQSSLSVNSPNLKSSSMARIDRPIRR